MAHIFQFQLFKDYGILAGVSTRKVGSIKEKRQVNDSVVKRIMKEVDVDSDLILMNQIHSGIVKEVGNTNQRIVPETDGIVSKGNVVLGVITADCVPLVFYDYKNKIKAVAHAGYKGILSGIVENTISKLYESGANKETLLVGIGPCIQDCCYDVPFERVEKFKEKYNPLHNMYTVRDGKYLLSLRTICKNILHSMGVVEENIDEMKYCTSCNNDLFFSYRKDSSETFGEFVSFVK